MSHYKAEVYRDGRWWMVRIPDIDGLTQARRIGEVELMAREYIAVDTGTPLADIEVTIHSVTVPGLGDVAAEAASVRSLREQVTQAEARAASAAAFYAKNLTEAGIPVRDIAELIGVSPQRVSQIANA